MRFKNNSWSEELPEGMTFKKVLIKLIPSFLKWLVLLPIYYFMVFLTYLLSPILPVFAITTSEIKTSKEGCVEDTLPKWLNWFQTPRDPLSGNGGFQEANKHLPQWLIRTKWLIRNPAYGFNHSVTGTHTTEGTKMFYKGNPLTHDQYAGVLFIWTEDYKYFNLKIYLPTLPELHLPFGIFIRASSLKFRIGWKLHDWLKNGYTYGHERKYLATVHPLKEREFI